jgi:hypothetical protein
MASGIATGSEANPARRRHLRDPVYIRTQDLTERTDLDAVLTRGTPPQQWKFCCAETTRYAHCQFRRAECDDGIMATSVAHAMT